MESALKVLVGLACVTTIVCGSVYLQKNVGYAGLPFAPGGLVLMQK